MDASDKGYLFESPPRRDKRSWEVVEVLASCGLRFNKSSSSAFIEQFITDYGSLHPSAVRSRIEHLMRNRAKS
jgi:hypothetical protein